LCQQLEEFALQNSSETVAVPIEISTRWKQIDDKVTGELADRYKRTVTRLTNPVPAQLQEADIKSDNEEQPADPKKSAAQETLAQEDAKQQRPEPAQAPQTESPLPAILQQLEALRSKSKRLPPAGKFQHLQDQWQRAWTSISDPGDADLELHETAKQLIAGIEQAFESAREQKEKAVTQAQSLLGKMESELEDGALHKALETKYQLSELAKSFKNDSRWKTINQQMTSFHGRIRELRDWHHWSNDKIRKQLIGEMEILPVTDLHPDAILDRIKSLQSKWKDLEKSEQIPGDSHYHAAPWMWRKFSTAGNKAFEATKPFLDKRDEIRDRHLQEVKQLCSELVEASKAQNPNFQSLNKLLQRTRKEMRDLEQIPQTVIQGNYEAIERAKLKLVRAAAHLVHVEDMAEAISEAKRLQADWKSAGRLWRSRENELWKAFREPLDPLFGKLKATQDGEREEIRERLQVQEDLCSNLKELLTEKDQVLLESGGKVQGLKDSWRDIEHPNRPLQQKFQDLADQFERRIADFRHQQADKIRENWWDKAGLLHQLETAILDGSVDDQAISKAQKAWPQQDSSADIDQILNARFKLLVDSREVAENNKKTALHASELCIQMEFLAGIPSPKSDKDQRMKYQVDRLSKSLSGDGERLSAAEEARFTEQEWLKLAVLPGIAHKKFERRLKSALGELFRSNSV
jgi:hypothetical protein